MELVRVAVVTISSGQSLSAAIDLLERTVFAIEMPADWDAANLTFQGSSDLSGTYQDVYREGTEVNITAAADRYIVFDPPTKLAGVRFIKVRSGTSASPVNQTDSRTLTLMGQAIQ